MVPNIEKKNNPELFKSATSPVSPSQHTKKFLRTTSWQEISFESHFNIGLILNSTCIRDMHVSAINKPASRCHLSSLVILNPNEHEADCDDACSDDSGENKNSNNMLHQSVERWLERNKIAADVNDLDYIGTGKASCDKMLQSDQIHAVYIIVPPCSQKEYVLQALNAKKHVLANDPTSVHLKDFVEELECAKTNGKFIQTTAMFVHQYRVQRFLNHVLQDENFGRINGVDASIQLQLQPKDLEKVGIVHKLPLRKEDGCIRVLGRFCVLVSTMFFNRVGSYAESAKVNSWGVGPNGEIVSADCTVQFTNDRKLGFYVAYIHSATRQAIELQATSRYATMNDFVIEHPDGLATYRVYDREARQCCGGGGETNKDKASNQSSSSSSPTNTTNAALHCDSIDVAMGIGQERGLWRSFVRLSQQIDGNHGWEDNEAIAECKELTDVALQMKKILIALMQSLENGGKEVPVEGCCI